MNVKYDCSKCPAYCCSYPRIIVKKRDVQRLARHFGLSPDAAMMKFTKKGTEKGERILRKRKDEFFGEVCRFLDRETRNCTVYPARPEICRDFPGRTRCGYYEFLKFERRAQDDPDYVPRVMHE